VTEEKVELLTLEGMSFDVVTHRGYAKLCDLARISAPDTYDEKNNPGGIQRDLDTAHARAAYLYAHTGEGKVGERRIWPELFLNVRDPSVVEMHPIQKYDGERVAKLIFHLDKVNKEPGPKLSVSRVDGNHRLWYAAGDTDERLNEPVEVITPFCITIGLSVEEEQAFFKDINDNQKGMNTSHLDNIVYRLKPKEWTIAEEPALWIAEQLHSDPLSPFHGVVYRGGIRTQGTQRLINLRSLKNGVELILNESEELKAMPSPPMSKRQAQYVLIRNYWNAVKNVFSADWQPKGSLLLKGVGYRALSIAGAYVIDRCFRGGKTDSKDMEPLVEKIRKAKIADKTLSWDPKGPLADWSGMKAVKDLGETLKAAVASIDESLVQQLAKQA